MADIEQLEQWIAKGEQLDGEFKSDRGGLNDSTLYEEIVALANSEGGVLLIGVEDDGSVTGARPRHGHSTDPLKLQAAIFNNTVPSINTRISVIAHPAGPVIAVEVDRYPEPCATCAGKSLRRLTGPDGKPQTVPFYPRDQRSRRIDLGLLDFSAQPMESASLTDLDPLEFERLRQTISRLRGDRALLPLSNEEMAKALRLVETLDGRLVPNVAGLLLLGREDALLRFIPTHEVNFQVLDARAEVKVNDGFHGPLARVLEEISARFDARNEERETAVGFLRFPVPDYSPDGFREAVGNAILHRDFTRLGAVYVQWHPDHLFIASPGGFPEGITAENILVHEPKPRNPRLADAFRRIGLVEQTGRGVDRIYLGQLNYGRPIPDYSRSDASAVRVILRGGRPSLAFAAFVFEEAQNGRSLALDELLILNELFFERRIDSEAAGRLSQNGTSQGRVILERLHERGLIEARGERKGRVYHLAASLYKRLSMEAEYIRAKGFEPLQHEQMVLDYVKAHGRITRSEASDLCKISGPQASRMLARLADKHPEFKRHGQRRGAHYTWEN